MVKYIPTCGDVVWLEFDPQAGKEIQKTRPAVVISPYKYNEKIGLALFMPITSQIKGYPFEVIIHEKSIQGAVLCDQIRSLDWRVRKAKFIMHLPTENMANIKAKFIPLLNF
jgi:mRNA interferase MazF